MQSCLHVALCCFLVGLSFVLQGCHDGGGGSGGGGTGGAGTDGTPPAVDLIETGLKGISYAPMFLHDPSCLNLWAPQCATGFETDDFTAEWAAPIWGDAGRGDLQVLQSLGANTVRLYGNDPRFSKTGFLDAAKSHNLQVIFGISSYWYTGAGSGGGPKCAVSGEEKDCFTAIRSAYGQNLNGGVADKGYYHNAISIVNIMNEPDFLGKHNYLKAMVAAFDGILSAEQDAGIKHWTNGKLPKLTTTWSFATQADGLNVCDAEHLIHDKTTECGPGLTFMVQFNRAVQDPSAVGYTPKNNLWVAYQERWINSVNPFNPADELMKQFIQPYMALDMFKGIHTFFGEWHPTYAKPTEAKTLLTADLLKLLSFGKNTSFIGASYFEYQVAYQKTGTERNFGLFDLGAEVIGQTGYITGDVATSHPVNCLKPGPFVASIVKAWGGDMPSKGMCAEELTSAVVV
eukprot:TRINITY_DN68339_c0_g1_i1.p1 TRINITY_DN68339_c0_g1~~TRINITY_DN68339_c0_g1_i1.p1  ORF type:complete len:458 (+),score=53.93 TRINITY_DN68339_c0_g1_i1:59-1432(+)